jgi:hypothetical protein
MSEVGQKCPFRTSADDFRSSPVKRHSQRLPACLKGATKEPSAYRRYLLDSSRASFQIPAIGLYALFDRAAVDSFAPDGAVKAPRSMGLITPLTGGACARHDLRKPDGPAPDAQVVLVWLINSVLDKFDGAKG